jgi:drug/metabolite transporter (DMT)-like permease
MKTLCATALSALFFLCLFAAFERPAYAYIDPGSSLLLYQSLSAMVAGAAFYLRRRIKGLFSRRLSSPAGESSFGDGE